MTENQKLREALSELMSIVSIHQKATGNNFAWAEMDFAREALALPTAAPVGEREAFEQWLGITPCGAAHDFGWAAWQARAAIAKATGATHDN